MLRKYPPNTLNGIKSAPSIELAVIMSGHNVDIKNPIFILIAINN